MALFLGAKGDILALRGSAELVNSLKGRLAERLAFLPTGEQLEFLRGLKGRIAEELAFEEGFAAEFAGASGELEQAPGDMELATAYLRAMELAARYFRERGSVLAAHSLCTDTQEILIRRALQLTTQWMEEQGFGSVPPPFCWFTFGSLGRREGSFNGGCDTLFVHAATDRPGAAYFARFCPRVSEVLKVCGMREAPGFIAADHAWFGRMAQWRSWLTGKNEGLRSQQDFARLAPLADLRLVAGKEKLAAELLNLVYGLLDFYQGTMRELPRDSSARARTRAAARFAIPALRDLARSAAEMPTGFDFFGRLRLERGGEHRGKFNLELFAITPLVDNIRMLALKCGIADTSTVGRIKQVAEAGGLSVELAERLLRAYQVFTRQQLLVQLGQKAQGGEGLFIDPEALSEEEAISFKGGLEALVVLQRIVYQSFAEQG